MRIIIPLLLLCFSVKAEHVALLATNFNPGVGWTYAVGGDSEGGAWKPGGVNTISATVSLGRTFSPGPVSIYIKAGDYDLNSTVTFTAGDATSNPQTLYYRDEFAYWTTNVTIIPTVSFDEITFDFVRGVEQFTWLQWFAIYVTQDTNEIVLRDDRVLRFTYPTGEDVDPSDPVKGNLFPNSSFEGSLGVGWRISLIGRTNTLLQCWDTNVSFHGLASMRLPATSDGTVFAIQSQPFLLASNKSHTLSFYAKASAGQNRVSWRLKSAYVAPNGYPDTFEANGSTLVGDSWTRVSVTPTNVPWYPNGEYFVQIETRQDVSPPVAGGPWTHIDAIQVEEGGISDYAPREQNELGILLSEPSGVFYPGGLNRAEVRLWNEGAGATKTVQYQVINWTNVIVQSGQLPITVGSSNLAVGVIDLPSQLGWFSIRAWINGMNSDVEMPYIIIRQPRSNPVIGLHIDALGHVLEVANRMGFNRTRTTSSGQHITRWDPYVESEAGVFVAANESVDLYLENGFGILGTLGEDAPSHAKDAVFLQLTNASGLFTPGQLITSENGSGNVATLLYETNGTGLALQLTNITGSFGAGAITGGVTTATVVNSPVAGTINLNAWDRYVNFMATNYDGRILDWEMWNEPDQEAEFSELGAMRYPFYSEMVRRATLILLEINPENRIWIGGGVQTFLQLSNILHWLPADFTNQFHGFTVHQYPTAENNAAGIHTNIIQIYGKPVMNSESGGVDKGSMIYDGANFWRGGAYAFPYKSGDSFYDSRSNVRQIAINLLTCLGHGMSAQYYYDWGDRIIDPFDFDSRQYTALERDKIRIKGASLAALNWVLDGALGLGPLPLSSSDAVAFLFTNNSPIVAFWSTSTNKQIALNESFSLDQATDYDMMGNSASLSSSTVRFGITPRVIVFNSSVTLSNAASAFTNGTVSGFADLSPPNLRITSFPRTKGKTNVMYHVRALAFDEDVPNEFNPDAIVYSTQLAGGDPTVASGEIFRNFMPSELTEGSYLYTVIATDKFGNSSTNTVTLFGDESSVIPRKVRIGRGRVNKGRVQ